MAHQFPDRRTTIRYLVECYLLQLRLTKYFALENMHSPSIKPLFFLDEIFVFAGERKDRNKGTHHRLNELALGAALFVAMSGKEVKIEAKSQKTFDILSCAARTRKSAHVAHTSPTGCAQWRRRPSRYASSTGCTLGSG